LSQIVSAPPIFRTAWEFVKKWVDPGTLSKISVLSPSESRQVLLAYIEPSSLPEQYGGTLKWKWGDMPNLDILARKITCGLYGNGQEQFVKGHMIMLGDTIEVLGTVEGERRKIVVEFL
jgi:hypothetical protein